MSSIDLSRLDAEEFADEMRESMFDEAMWAAFVEDDTVVRTRVALTAFAGNLRSQLENHGADDRDWARRARNLLRRVDSRITEVNVAIRDRNKRQTASAAAVSKKWSTLALELAEALSDSDMEFLLDEIHVEGITARGWLDKRRTIAAAKEMAS